MAAPSIAAAPTIVGKDAPDFVLRGMDGRNLRLSEFRGQVVLVNFWARWEGDSRQQMPALDRINTTYQRAGLVVLGVSVDEDLRRARDFAAGMGVTARAEKNGHDFRYRMPRGERARGLIPADYIGDWLAAEKALTGVEVRDPTADIDVISFCFGIPATQYLVEDVDRSLIRRAMWGLLPEEVLANRKSGAHAPDCARRPVRPARRSRRRRASSRRR